MWLWSAGRGHLAVSVTRELCHIFSQLSITFSCQPRHCHWHSDHGDRLPGLPRCYQGKQVPPVERKTLLLLFTKNSGCCLVIILFEWPVQNSLVSHCDITFGFQSSLGSQYNIPHLWSQWHQWCISKCVLVTMCPNVLGSKANCYQSPLNG